MQEMLSDDLVRPIAWTHLNALRGTGVLPPTFEDVTIARAGQPIYDLDGQILFQRVPLTRGDSQVGFADIAVNPALGTPFLAASLGPWSVADVLDAARREAKRREIAFDDVRIVAYSYPKLAAQFLQGDREVLMLELFSWVPVPEQRTRRGEPPGNFERWSLLESIGDRRGPNAERFGVHVRELRTWLADTRLEPPREGPGAATASGEFLVLERQAVWKVSARLGELLFPPRLLLRARELHYSTRNQDHHPCYELRGQVTSVWCVAASVQMVLDFYRYNYSQDRLAEPDALDLGTRLQPHGLPYAEDARVVTTLERMTRCALTAAMDSTPTFGEFVTEIEANRPVVSFIPGHSRTVAGYWHMHLPFGGIQFHGLLVYDPWPPAADEHGGVITRYENFDSSTYRVSFTARVATVP